MRFPTNRSAVFSPAPHIKPQNFAKRQWLTRPIKSGNISTSNFKPPNDTLTYVPIPKFAKP